MKRLIFATNNTHKLEEARAILGDGVRLVSLQEIGCHDDIPETKDTLAGNALQKARYIHSRYGVDCVADDTGLMVDALGGAPGVYSARYAGPGHDSQANMELLLRNMEGVADRKAHFSTMLAYVSDTCEKVFEGRVDGRIATRPSGNAGFGYDPLFEVEDTGRTFADMDAAEKNSLSHRGRAFRLFRDWFAALVVLFALFLTPAPARAEQWRMHPSYNGQPLRIIDTPKLAYFLLLRQEYKPTNPYGTEIYGQLLRYDKENDEWKWLGTDDGLAEHIVVNAAYDHRNRILAIAYDNGNIDLLRDNGDVVNVPGLKMAQGNASTRVRDISVDPAGGGIWFATASGYVSVDPVKGEVMTSRDYGQAVNTVARYGDVLFVGTDDALYYGDPRGSDLSKFARVPDSDHVLKLFTADGRTLWMVASVGRNHVSAVLPDGDGYVRRMVSLSDEYSVEPGASGVLTCGRRGLRWIKSPSDIVDLGKPSGFETPLAGSLDGRSVWFSNGRKGLSRMSASDGRWTVTMTDWFPEASNVFWSVAMAYSPTYGMLVRNHGNEQEFQAVGLRTEDLLCSYRDGVWKPRSITYAGQDPWNVFEMRNPIGVAIDPQNPDHVYCGSAEFGLLRLDLADPSRSLHMSRSNEAGAGRPGFVTVTDPAKGWDTACFFSAPTFDSRGNMWTARLDFDTNTPELWCWSAADRAASTGTASFRPFSKITLRGTVGSGRGIVLPLRRTSDVVVYHGGNGSDRPCIVYHAGTPGVTADDRQVNLGVLTDQDGTEFDPGAAKCMWEDPSTGLVWVTGAAGVYTFSPSAALAGSLSVQRIKVPRNDGSNLADYLLDNTYVATMTADPLGRKWFATYGGGIVVTSESGRQVLRSYTTGNSGLPDDNVYGLCYNPDSNSMMVSTGKGLCELFLTAAGDDGGDDIRAYPNPVRPEYLGNVTVDGLPEGATVKVTDLYNGLVKDMGQSVGGEIEWNLTDNNNKRVPSGIYYIHATNGEEQDKYSKMTKIMVVN